MTLIQGKNGRMYDTTTGKRVDSTVAHPELRSDRELRAAAQASAPKQPTGVPDPDTNPHRRHIAEHVQFKGPVWAKSRPGREWITGHKAKADEWDRRRAAQLAEAERVESVRPLTEHAAAHVQQTLDDPLCTVEDCELAVAALEAALAGDRDAYAGWEKSRHDQLITRLAHEAAEHDQAARTAAARRDDILRSGIDYTPTPIPEVASPTAAPIVDRTKAAIVRRVQVGPNSFREETEIVDV